MDAQVTRVLDEYHARIAREEQLPFGAPGGGRDDRLLPVGPETGQLINIIARSLKAPTILEIGTSYGYSAIWLGEAARASGGRVITLELQDYKSAHAHEKAVEAGLADHVDYRVGDALDLIERLETKVDFVLLDLWKDLYEPCFKALRPKLNPGAIIVADNMIYPGGEGIAQYARAVAQAPDFTSVLLPVGAGIEVSRYQPA